eukprot:695975_1
MILNKHKPIGEYEPTGVQTKKEQSEASQTKELMNEKQIGEYDTTGMKTKKEQFEEFQNEDMSKEASGVSKKNDHSPKLELSVKPLRVPEHFTKSGEIILNFVKPTWTTVYKIKTQRYFEHFVVTPDRNMNANLKLELHNSGTGSIKEININNDWKKTLESDDAELNAWSFEIPLRYEKMR